jgi:hypothetical protein
MAAEGETVALEFIPIAERCLQYLMPPVPRQGVYACDGYSTFLDSLSHSIS